MRLSSLLKTQIKEALRHRGYLVTSMDDLTKLADHYGSDKGTLADGHGYTRVYKRLFEPLRHRELVFLEMGLLNPRSDRRRRLNAAEGATDMAATRAPSLEMWREFFPNAMIYGFDIDDFSQARIAGCTILRGDMSSPRDLATLARAIGRPIDIVIDDASHISHHQQIALGCLFPHMRSGGMYIIEDLGWQDEELEKEGVPKTRDVLRRLQVNGRFESPAVAPEMGDDIERNVDKIWLFDSLTATLHDATDSLAVLVRK
jgi:hypothetical protein